MSNICRKVIPLTGEFIHDGLIATDGALKVLVAFPHEIHNMSPWYFEKNPGPPKKKHEESGAF